MNDEPENTAGLPVVKAEPGFDCDTAQALPYDTVPLPHRVYRDANGALCLWACSRMKHGGVAISAAARAAFESLDGRKFVRLTNHESGLDVLLPLEQVPFGLERNGKLGPVYLVDIVPPPFTPLGVSPYAS